MLKSTGNAGELEYIAEKNRSSVGQVKQGTALANAENEIAVKLYKELVNACVWRISPHGP